MKQLLTYLTCTSKVIHYQKDYCNKWINETSLNKTDVHSFPKKSLFTFRMVRVFINAQLKLVVLLPDFSWSRYNGSNERKNSEKFQNIFVFNSNGFSHTTTSDTLADGNRQPRRRKMSFLRMPNFSRSYYLH